MQPTEVQRIGEELAIKWDDGTESYIRLETLRRHCPCAACQGEPDVLGNLHRGPPTTLTASSFQLRNLIRVGSYALQPVWADGHNSGIYAFEYLRTLAPPSA
jgi:DUF971 family protein